MKLRQRLLIRIRWIVPIFLIAVRLYLLLKLTHVHPKLNKYHNAVAKRGVFKATTEYVKACQPARLIDR